MKFKLILRRVGLIIGGIIIFFFALVFITTYHPPRVRQMKISSTAKAQLLKSGQKLKILSWNIQYFAGKNYVFWYDQLDGKGPHSAIKREDINATFGKILRVINNENPDVILIQEFHDGAKRTYYEDQLQKLVEKLPKEYCYYTEAFYWKAAFVPLPQIMGSVGMKLGIISKYKINKATRYQLPVMPKMWLEKQLQFRRAILEARLPIEGGAELALLNTHMDAFSQGSDTMTKQVATVDRIISRLTKDGVIWAIGGDFNLLPPGAYEYLDEAEKEYYNPQTELKVLTDKYKSIPSIKQTTGDSRTKWFTHFPNSIKTGPDRTIDYIFYSDKLQLANSYVRQTDTLDISDHLPMIAEFVLPASVTLDPISPKSAAVSNGK